MFLVKDVINIVDIALKYSRGESLTSILLSVDAKYANLQLSEVFKTLLHFDTAPINQSYRLSNQVKQKTLNLKTIISVNRFFNTKHDEIILYEYFHSLQEDGFLLIAIPSYSYDFDYQNQCIENLCNSTRSLFEILNIKKTESGSIFCLKKNNYLIPEKSTYQKWTFGFITNGTKNEFINNQIERIASLGLDEWEVIVCGTFTLTSSSQKHVRYIPFTEKDDKGWITKKKNLICQAATYENLVILHDRYIIPLDFVEKMEAWGNDFDLLGARQIYHPSQLDRTPIRCQDWMTYSRPLEAEKEDRSCDNIGLLEPHDWDKWCYITGGVYIVKRSLMLKVPQDEDLFWNEVEDIKFCHDFTKAGYLIRFNPNLVFESISYRWPALVIQYRQNPYQLGKKTTSQETLIYWYLILLDSLFLSKEIQQALNQFANDFFYKIKKEIVKNPNFDFKETVCPEIINFRQLNQWCTEVMITPLISESIKNLDEVTQTRLAFNLIIGRPPSPNEEVVWVEKHKKFEDIVGDLLFGAEFQYRIRSAARAKYTPNSNDDLLLKIISIFKPLILLIIAIFINLIIISDYRLFRFVKKLIKKIIGR